MMSHLSLRLVVTVMVAGRLVAACGALDRHRPHPQPSPPRDECVTCSGDENVPNAGDFQYYILAKFNTGTLHGLWPNNCNPCPHDYPEHCSEEEFDIDSIAPETLARMRRDWPSGVGSDETFWEHEWICHGTCSGMDIPTYFARAVQVYESSSDSREERSCYTKNFRPTDCPAICPYEKHKPHRLRGEESSSNRTMTAFRLLSMSAAPQNKGCPPQSGTCRPKRDVD